MMKMDERTMEQEFLLIVEGFESPAKCESPHENTTCSGAPVATLHPSCHKAPYKACLSAVLYIQNSLSARPHALCDHCLRQDNAVRSIGEYWKIEPL